MLVRMVPLFDARVRMVGRASRRHFGSMTRRRKALSVVASIDSRSVSHSAIVSAPLISGRILFGMCLRTGVFDRKICCGSATHDVEESCGPVLGGGVCVGKSCCSSSDSERFWWPIVLAGVAACVFEL